MSTNGPSPTGRDPKKPNTNDPNRPSNNSGKTYSGEPSRSSYSSGSSTPGSTTPLPGSESQYRREDKEQERYRKESGESFEHKVKDTIQNIKESEFYHYAASNKEQTISYILLAIGIILLLIRIWFIGGLLIGGVFGYHFAAEIMYYIRNVRYIFEGPDQLRYIILAGLVLGLLITTPGIVIGALAVALFKHFVLPTVGTRGQYSDRNYPKSNNRSNDYRNKSGQS